MSVGGHPVGIPFLAKRPRGYEPHPLSPHLRPLPSPYRDLGPSDVTERVAEE